MNQNRFFLLLFCALGMASLLSAQTITFAQFTQVNPDKSLVFDNGQFNSASFNTTDTTTGVDVQFRYNDQLSFTGALSALDGMQDARMTLKSTVQTPATSSDFGTLRIQPVDSGVIEFKRATAIDGKDLLLAIHFTGAYLVDFGSSGSLFAAENANSTITYTSDFLNFDPTTPENWSLGLSGVSPVAIQAPNQLLSSFTASTAGTFDANATAIPEPATYGLLMGLAALIAVIRWRSHSARHSVV